MLDKEVTERQVIELANADATEAFFAWLGYDTSGRIQQPPANLGIIESLHPQIRRCELLADQEGSLQVYLFELASVTVTSTKALARAYHNRTGRFLLVLTSDYERIDFVLLEELTPEATGRQTAFARPQVKLRPRTLTLHRRRPSRVELRVLRRFTYTEPDPFAQYDKLLSAYAVADWSEEHFNNRALFSDYYLKERFREDYREAWGEDPKPMFRSLSETHERARERWVNKTQGEIIEGLIGRTLAEMGFQLDGHPSTRGAEKPDAVLCGPDGTPLAYALAYPWGRFLDGKDYTRDSDTADDNPGARVLSVLEAGELDWAIVTNGKIWRLYSARTHSRATNYYEVDLEETLALGDPEAFRYFWLLFRRQAFETRPIIADGEERRVSFLTRVLEGSADYAKKLGERLKERVFIDIFPYLAEGFIEYRKATQGDRADLSQPALDDLFQATLTLLYRLLFILYSEARDLLPAKEVRGYYEQSFERMRREVAEVAGPDRDTVDQRIKQHFSTTDTALYDRLSGLFTTVDKGDSRANVPIYNGGLFLTSPSPEDPSAEAHTARLLLENKVPDYYLARALDLLARDMDEKTFELVPIDYKSLGVRQLGSIYEGLLEFQLRIASERMAVCRGKDKTELVIPYREAKKAKGLTILKDGKGKNARDRTYPAGTVYLENTRHERRASGSYYTPEYIVEYVVRHTVGPVLDEKFEALRSQLREAQRAYREAVKRRDGFRKVGKEGDDPEKAANAFRHVVEDLFDLKVLDPAIGSGHFLVEAVDYITDRTIDFLNGFPWNPVIGFLREMRQQILEQMDEQAVSIDRGRLTDVNLLKRHVLKRCIYGVDLSPMAVELAKVSLWLDCFTLGAPLSFLDHHLKCGNSLIGSRVTQVIQEVGKETRRVGGKQAGTWYNLFGGPFQGLLAATTQIEELRRIPDATTEQVRSSASIHRGVEAALQPYKEILNIWVSQYFGNSEAKDFLKLYGEDALRALRGEEVKLSPEYHKAITEARTLAAEKRFFHWDLEFPEAFIDLDRRDWKPTEHQGFDSVIGNPPYDELSEVAAGHQLPEKRYFREVPAFEPALGGRLNLFRLFIAQAVILLRRNGQHSYIVPLALLCDQFTANIRRHLLERTSFRLIENFPQKDDPTDRVFAEAKLSTTVYVTVKDPARGRFTVRTHPGRDIREESPSCLIKPDDLVSFDPEGLCIPQVSEPGWLACRRLSQSPHMTRFAEVCEAHPGEIMLNKQFEKFISRRPTDHLLLRGANIDRYELNEDPKQGEPVYLKASAYLSSVTSGNKARHHNVARIAFQRGSAIDNWRRIIATMIDPGFFLTDTVGYVAQSQYSLWATLALLNSPVSEWRFRLTSTNNHVSPYEIALLPARRIHFATPPAERGRLLKELEDLYATERLTEIPGRVEELLPRDAEGSFTAFHRGASGTEEKSDVVHDFLAFLAQHMVELKKTKQAEVKRFLIWLESQMGAEVDDLSGKTFLKEFYNHSAEDLLNNVLAKNRTRLRVNPMEQGFRRRFHQEYDQSLSALEPIIRSVGGKFLGEDCYPCSTDWLIDQIVYKLYGLTEDEVAVVEGSLGR